jgi:hypothetical protein
VVLVAASVAAVVAASALAVGTAGFGLFNGPAVAESQFGQHGQRLLGDIGAPGNRAIALVGTRAGISFYRVQRQDGTNCWAAGAAGAAPDVDGAACPAAGESFAFPSRDQPVLDFSEFAGADRANVVPVRLAGLAADGVAKVGLADASGKIVATTPVANNIYATKSLPNVVATQVVAFDRNGNVLYTQCPYGGCR